MTGDSKRLLDERLEELRRHLKSAINLEQARLDDSLRRHAESQIAEIQRRAEDSIQKAVEQYDRDMAKADEYARNPATAILAERARESAKKVMDLTIASHRQMAETGIQSIKDIMRQHQSRSRRSGF